ncbi:hypothetical protein ACHAQJ_009370 [Trichoderma viride]
MLGITKILLLVSTAAAIVLPRDAITVQNDITQKIGPQWTTLDNDAKAFPASGLTGALSIHSDVQSLVAVTNNATADVKAAGAFSEADGTTILADLQSLIPTIHDALSVIGSQAPAWANIPGGQSLILSDLQHLNSSSVGFLNALITASPADLVPSAASVKTQILGGFNSAIAAYSS